jgi:hypothetical protein
VLADCVGGERLVYDIGEGSGNLDSILCLARGDEMLSIMNVGRGKLGWTTSNGLWKCRTPFGAKSGDGRAANTSSLGDVFTRMTSIK